MLDGEHAVALAVTQRHRLEGDERALRHPQPILRSAADGRKRPS
jgi:hypothetical protein